MRVLLEKHCLRHCLYTVGILLEPLAVSTSLVVALHR
jgi:hypothetical protein